MATGRKSNDPLEGCWEKWQETLAGTRVFINALGAGACSAVERWGRGCSKIHRLEHPDLDGMLIPMSHV